MLVVGVDGCKQVKQFLDQVVKDKGAEMVKEGAVEKNDAMGMDLDD
jgi:exosome complex component RRP41